MVNGFNLFPEPRVSSKSQKFLDRSSASLKEQDILREAKAGRRADQIAAAKIKALKAAAGARTQAGNVTFEAGQAMAMGARQQQVTFSREQEMLGEMFGGGEKIWGNVQEPIRINNDLNSSRSDPFDETAGMFGAGPGGERSGLF